MSIRVDSAQLIPGSIVVGGVGLGVPASSIPSTGDSGAGYLFNDIAAEGAAPSDEMRGEIVTWPSAGTLAANEDSSFSFTGAPDGVYTATYRGYRNGVGYGDYTITLTIGSGVNYNIGGVSSVAITASADTQRATTAGGITSLAVSATADTQRNTAIGGVSSVAITARGNLIDGDQPRFGVIRLLPSTVRIKIRVGA